MTSTKEASFKVFRGSKSGKIVEDTTTRSIGPDDALVRMSASGLCGTDLHYLKAGCVLGHEGVGIVEDIGPDVHNLKKGDRVGFGYIQSSCGLCNLCLQGMEQYCASSQWYGRENFDIGSFAEKTVWKANMLLKIPDGMDLKDAAPLMCGGATVWTALTQYGLKAGDRVGVQGLGGLGHLAVQFAAKLGADVTVLSSSDKKKEESFNLGATDYLVLDDNTELLDDRKLDHLLVCGSGTPDYKKLITLMAMNGKIYPLTVSSEAPPIPLLDLTLKGISIQGSVVGSRPHIRTMLDFAARHGIKPITMQWDLTAEGIEEALQTLNTGKMRYRGVFNIALETRSNHKL